MESENVVAFFLVVGLWLGFCWWLAGGIGLLIGIGIGVLCLGASS